MDKSRLTLVLLPGMDGTGNLFEPLITALGSRYAIEVVRYATDQPAGYAELTRYAVQCLPRDADFVLLGESFSGPVAVDIAASRPRGLVGVILCCTFIKNPRPGLKPFAPLARLLPLATGAVMSFLLLGRRATPHLRALLESSVRQVSPGVMRRRVAAVLDVDVTGRMAQVGVPVLYIGGTEDRIVPPSAARLVARVAAGVQFAALKAPHCLLQTVPDEAARLISSTVDGWRTAVADAG